MEGFDCDLEGSAGDLVRSGWNLGYLEVDLEGCGCDLEEIWSNLKVIWGDLKGMWRLRKLPGESFGIPLGDPGESPGSLWDLWAD